MSIYIRKCQTCGVEFEGGPRAWYCPECREKRKKEQSKQAKRRKANGLTRSIGSIDICQNCGNKYTVSSGNQKYCEECAPEMIKKIDAEQSLKYYHENKEEINPKRNERRRCPLRRCAVCQNEFAAVSKKKYCSKECAEKVAMMLRPAYEANRKRNKKDH